MWEGARRGVPVQRRGGAVVSACMQRGERLECGRGHGGAPYLALRGAAADGNHVLAKAMAEHSQDLVCHPSVHLALEEPNRPAHLSEHSFFGCRARVARHLVCDQRLGLEEAQQRHL